MKGHSPTPPFGHSSVAASREAVGQIKISAPGEQRLVSVPESAGKAGTDKTKSSCDTRAAQCQLGRWYMKMTEPYVHERKGDKVDPTK
jgi:hypothetical protein